MKSGVDLIFTPFALTVETKALRMIEGRKADVNSDKITKSKYSFLQRNET